MFKRVLIANRGEIAIRIARAAVGARHRVGRACITPADALSLHTRLTTEAREIGGRRPIRCAAYLDVDAVIAAARASGCDCVHPGYGFLAENAAFAAALRGRGPALRRALARDAWRCSATRSRRARFAQSLGIPVVPGSAGAAGVGDEAAAAGAASSATR